MSGPVKGGAPAGLAHEYIDTDGATTTGASRVMSNVLGRYSAQRKLVLHRTRAPCVVAGQPGGNRSGRKRSP